MIADLTINDNHLINKNDITQPDKNHIHTQNSKGKALEQKNKFDPSYYVSLVFDVMLSIEVEDYFYLEEAEFNDYEFGSHAKLCGIKNVIIKKLSKKLEYTLFKIKNRTIRLNILEHLYDQFSNNLTKYKDLYLAIESYGIREFSHLYKILKRDSSIKASAKIKLYYSNFFEMLAILFRNSITLEHLLSSFEDSNPIFADIWKLFIEENLQSKGRLYFENEQGYLLSSLRGLAYAMNKFEYNRYINYDFLEEVSEIIGSSKRVDISTAINVTLNCDVEEVKKLFSRSFYTGEYQAIRIIETLLDCKLDDISKGYSKQNKKSEDDLARNYVLYLYSVSNHIKIFMRYISDTTTKKEYVNLLFSDYYKQIDASGISDLDFIVYISLDLCKELQYLHPLGDATGRVFLFILLPLLLCQHGYWLTSLPENVWDILCVSTEEMTNRILPLCSFKLQMQKPIDWQIDMNDLDKMFIACTKNKLETLLEIIDNDYELTELDIPLVNISPIEVALVNNSDAVFFHLLANNRFEFLKEKENEIISFVMEANITLYPLLIEYFAKIIDKDKKSREDFLKLNNAHN